MAERFAAVKKDANLRTGPGENYQIIGVVGDGLRVAVQAVSQPWASVKVLSGRHQGKDGFIHTSLLRYL